MIIPIPKYEEPDPVVALYERYAPDMHERIRKFLDCPNWKCTCGLTNFGRNKQCAKWECKKPRPTDYIEGEYK
jgi:hypothetical protein